MNTNGLQKGIKLVGAKLSKNAPTIFTALGVTGVVSTGVSACRDTAKAIRVIEQEENRQNRDLTKKEKIKTGWKAYIPTMLIGGASIFFIIAANTTSMKRNAALASVCTMTERALREYKDEVAEKLGPKETRALKESIDAKHVEQNPVKDNEVVITGKGNVLCYDAYSGRYFRSDMESIRRIQNDLNQELLGCMYMSLNEVYYALGLKPIPLGHDVGWNTDNLIDFDFSTQLSEDGEPCLVLDYRYGPRSDYKSVWA